VIRELLLRDFRCHERVRLILGEGQTIFCGPNGSGKSALLEAIYFGCRLRSFRQATPRNMVRHGAASFEVSLATDRDHLEANWAHGKRRLVLNGVETPSIADYWGTVPCVALVPWDIRLVTGPAAEARRFLSALASQLDRGAIHAFLRYRRLAGQRQALVAAHNPDRSLLCLLTEQMRDCGEPLQQHRRRLVRRLAAHAARAYREISGGSETLELTYNAGPWHVDVEAELSAGRTLMGLQRDSLRFLIGKHDARHHASEGQLRSAAIAIRAAEIAVLRGAGQQSPVVLVDDVFGELDPARRAALARLIPPGAQLIATVADGRWIPETLVNAHLIQLPLARDK